MAETFDEVFFDGGAVALKEAECVGSFSPVEDGALDVALVADEEQWQAVLGNEARALSIGQGSDRDRFALAGKRIFLEAKTEGVELCSVAGIGGHFAVCKTKPLGLADGFFPIDHPFA